MGRTRKVFLRASAFAAFLFFGGCHDTVLSPSADDTASIQSTPRPPDNSPTAPVGCITTNPDPPEISEGGVVILDASCSQNVGSTATFQWQLGDGRNRSGPRAEARYDRSGEYVVVLTVTDRGMSSTATSRVQVRARPVNDLTACFTFRDLTLAEEMLPCSIAFDASCSKGNIREYRWFFSGSPYVDNDDESVTTTTPEAEHTWSGDMECRFFRPFERLVRLTTVDDLGRTAVIEQMVPFAHISKE